MHRKIIKGTYRAVAYLPHIINWCIAYSYAMKTMTSNNKGWTEVTELMSVANGLL